MNQWSIVEVVTEGILRQLDSGVVPWKRAWPAGLPKSLMTGREYRGVNLLLLAAQGFSSRYWLSPGEAQRLGGQVRCGERSTTLLFWKRNAPEKLAQLRERSNAENLTTHAPTTASMFNFDQVEGLRHPADDTSAPRADRFEVADLMLDVMPDPPEILHVAAGGPSYCPRLDRITLPHLSQIKSGEEYYAKLFRGLVYSTGVGTRLNRFSQRDWDRLEPFSFEELVAEIGTAFLCAFSGLADPAVNSPSTSHAQGWAAALRKDPRLVVRAASAAQRAADYIRGKLVIHRNSIPASSSPGVRPAGRTASISRTIS